MDLDGGHVVVADSTVTSPNSEAADVPAAGPSGEGWVTAALTGVMLPAGR